MSATYTHINLIPCCDFLEEEKIAIEGSIILFDFYIRRSDPYCYEVISSSIESEVLPDYELITLSDFNSEWGPEVGCGSGECKECPVVVELRFEPCCSSLPNISYYISSEGDFPIGIPIGVFRNIESSNCYSLYVYDTENESNISDLEDFENDWESVEFCNHESCNECSIGCQIEFSDGNYITNNSDFLNYIGWFFQIDNQLTTYYINDVYSDNESFIVEIYDKLTGDPVIDFDPCPDFCLVKIKPRIEVSDEFIEVISVGFPIEINSDCFENNQFFVNSINGNEITVYSEEYSDLCVNGSFEWEAIGEEFVINSNYVNSGNYSFNGELYYLSVQSYESSTFYLYILFDGDVWVHYLTPNILDLSQIESIPYQDWPDDDGGIAINISQNLINNEWLNLSNPSIFGFELSTKYCDFDINDDCQGEICINYNSQLLQNKWVIIDDWKMDKTYNEEDIVIFDDILYQANTQSNIEDPTVVINGNQIKSGPFNSSEWDIYTDDYSIFWNPQKLYGSNSDFFENVVYSNDDFYEYVGGTEDFWNPVTVMSSGYNLGDTVYYKGKYYYSMTSSNHYTIDYTVGFENDILVSWRNRNNILFTPWVATHSTSPKWERIKLWNPSLSYNNGDYVVHENMVWEANINLIEPGEEPNISNLWDFKYDILPKIGFSYSQTNNKIIFMNNKYYLSTSLIGIQLDNGIIIYINKKWKNIFINININDDTLPNISNSDRDLLYNEIYSNITANNFIQAINDISNKYGFANYLKYVVIEEDGTITEHSFDEDITKLKHIITAEYPDKFEIRIDSLDKKVLEDPKKLKPTRVLNKSTIPTIDNLNWYNGSPLSVNIDDNLSEVPVIENYHNLKNIRNLDFYRFSGYYMPIFYDIELFKKAEDFEELGNWIFDDSLTEFGILKERKIKKVNRKGSILKLKDDDVNKSIYPMLDEFGYTSNDFFIFKSNWDFEYYIESNFFSLSFDKNDITDEKLDNSPFGKKNNNI